MTVRRSSLVAIVLLFTTLSFHPHAMAQTDCSWTTVPGSPATASTPCAAVITMPTPDALKNALEVRTGAAGGFISLGTSDASRYLLLYNGGYADQQAIAWPSGQDLRLGPVTSINGLGFAERMRIKGSGNVGIGTSNPQNLLDVRSPANIGTFMSFGTLDAAHYLVFYNGGYSDHQAIAWTAGEDLRLGTATGITPGQPFTEKMRIKGSGKVGIGMQNPNATLDVAGDVHATGSISADGALYAKYQDVAEWVPATVDMDPGTVVVLNRDKENEVMPSLRAYDIAVAGVVSAQPGLVLGVKGASKEQIATTGRVKVKVDATAGAVRVGDLLVTSSKPGFAMVSQAVEVAGVQLHRPGTVIGKALQPLATGTGEILVLLSLQ